MILNLDELRKVAEAPGVRPGPWHVYDRGIGYEVHDENDYELTGGMRETFDKTDAEFIATFDPPTVLALITELEIFRRRFDAMRRQRDGYRNQLRKAEQQVARVRDLLAYLEKLASGDKHYAELIDRDLDGDGRG